MYRKFFQCINQANWAISNGKLNVLPRFHTRPINVVVYDGSIGRTSFEVSFSLRCFQRLSLPYLASFIFSVNNNTTTFILFIIIFLQMLKFQLFIKEFFANGRPLPCTFFFVHMEKFYCQSNQKGAFQFWINNLFWKSWMIH